MNDANMNTLWASLLIEELRRCGVACFCYSSGARSGLLATGLVRHPHIQPVFHWDERASAFYALGHARATGRPSVWLTTSGSAVANGLPAVVEAAMEGIPLILLTADRPPELQDTRANQTIDQTSFLTSCTVWQAQLPCPDIALPAAYVLTTVDQAVARATQGHGGAVQINVPFREPLTEQPDGHSYADYLKSLRTWPTHQQPWTRKVGAHHRPDEDALPCIREKMEQAQFPVLVAGRLWRKEDRQALRQWVAHTRVTVWPDVFSGLHGLKDELIVPQMDLQLLAPERIPDPDLIVQVGAPVVSKRLQQKIDTAPTACRVVLQAHPHRQDSAHTVDWCISCDLPEWVERWCAYPPVTRRAAVSADQRSRAAVERVVQQWVHQGKKALDEASVVLELARQWPRTHGLFLGNSMPVRDWNTFASAYGADLPIAGNRGTSGIDGTLASACGWAAGIGRPVVVLLGDLSLLHDCTSLHYVRSSDPPVQVVVINNNGGGIFSHLPVAPSSCAPDEQDVFEQAFGTPHHLTFEHAAALFHLPYTRVDSPVALSQALHDRFQAVDSGVLEVVVDRAHNGPARRALQEKVMCALREHPAP